MATWKMTMGLALAGVMLTGSAFAQATMRSPATGPDEMVKAAQQALKEKGHNPGSVDGRMGPKTQQALRDFQNAQGIQATGELDAKTMVSLGIEPARTSSAGESTTAGSASPATGDAAVGSASGTS
ncbi:MAG TPA: peptidoglycan-binding domain-containing protein, partial [Methylomirabilota bacterium]|nr:peptidoglycan-binding domain-containing protein [Methylomirabilota bacterium]